MQATPYFHRNVPRGTFFGEVLPVFHVEHFLEVVVFHVEHFLRIPREDKVYKKKQELLASTSGLGGS
jgi:hypothetical protein